MLAAYRNAASDEEAIRRATGLSLSEFDAQFREYAREKTYNFAEAVVLRQPARGDAEHGAEPEIQIQGQTPEQAEERAETPPSANDYFARLRQAAQFEKERKFGQAIAEAATAKRLFPLYTDEGDPYRLLARIYEGQGQKQLAAAELLEWKVQKGRDPETFKKLAALLKELDRTPEAIRTLEDALYISMFDLEMHQRLGEWYLESENPRSAAREYRAVLALDPPDKAEAHYRLAMAYQSLSDRANARREVLAALEIAPGFRAAQRLLLELSGN
jgi:tetratricopeptide (TPR) repeat protein